MSRQPPPRPPLPPGPQPARRPLTLTVWRWELRKLRLPEATYLGLATGRRPAADLRRLRRASATTTTTRADNIFSSQITQSGLATPVLTLLFESAFMLPLAAALVAGDIVATEDGNGTLKTILTRSVDRGQVFAAKALAAMTYATIAVFLSAVVATIAGVVAWGFTHVSDLLGLGRLRHRRRCCSCSPPTPVYLIPLLTVVSIGVLLSTVTRNSAAAVVGTLGRVTLLLVLSADPGPRRRHGPTC